MPPYSLNKIMKARPTQHQAQIRQFVRSKVGTVEIVSLGCLGLRVLGFLVLISGVEIREVWVQRGFWFGVLDVDTGCSIQVLPGICGVLRELRGGLGFGNFRDIKVWSRGERNA